MENIIATISQIATNSIATISSAITNANNIVSETTKNAYDIAFPNLGIYIGTLKNNIKIGDFTIAYYGIIIAVGMLLAFFVATKCAKKIGISEDTMYDLFIIVILLGIIGARAYYVLFNLDYYSIRPYEILDIRAGGLGVYGGIILSIIGIIVYSIIKKCDIGKVLDAVGIAIPLGQAIGRYGNFFNMEAYGSYTNNIFAMRMNIKFLDSANISYEQLINAVEENGTRYIQAHPTFFYESTLNIVLFILLLYIFNKHYKFKGQLIATYFIGYGMIRFFVESLRTDSLMFYNYKVSQLVAIACVLIGSFIYILNIFFIKKKKEVVKVEEENDEKIVEEFILNADSDDENEDIESADTENIQDNYISNSSNDNTENNENNEYNEYNDDDSKNNNESKE